MRRTRCKENKTTNDERRKKCDIEGEDKEQEQK
jgi:hypothetical protein